jgi:hypothetical protein
MLTELDVLTYTYREKRRALTDQASAMAEGLEDLIDLAERIVVLSTPQNQWREYLVAIYVVKDWLSDIETILEPHAMGEEPNEQG